MLTPWWCSRLPREHDVSVVVDYADMTMTMYVLCGHYWKNFEGFSQILQEQSGEKRYSGVFTHPKAIILKIWKPAYLKKIFCMWFSNFAIKTNIFQKNEKVRKTVFDCSFGAQVESFKQKKRSKISWIVYKYCKSTVIAYWLTSMEVIFGGARSWTTWQVACGLGPPVLFGERLVRA